MSAMLLPPVWIVGVFVGAFGAAPAWAVALVVGCCGMAALEAVAALAMFVAWSGSEHA